MYIITVTDRIMDMRKGSSGAVGQKGSERSYEIAFDLLDRSRPVNVQNQFEKRTRMRQMSTKASDSRCKFNLIFEISLFRCRSSKPDLVYSVFWKRP